MPPATHGHPIDAAGIETAQEVVPTMNDALRLGALLGLLADPVRVRMLFALVSVLVQSRREGRVIYYRLADGFPHQMLEHCLHQLLTVADKEARA